MIEDGSKYPPGLVLMMTKGLDVACSTPILQCQEWRDYVPFGWADVPNGWLSHKVDDVTQTFPPMLSYSDYLESTGASNSLQSLYKYALETPSTDLGVLTTPSAVLVLIVLLFILRTIKSVLLPYFSKIGRRAARRTHGVEWEKQNEERIVKFGEYVFRLLYHSCVSAVGIWYFWDKEWWDHNRGGTMTLFRNYPFHEVAVGMTWYYLVQGAYNLDAMLSLAELSFDVTFQKPIQCGTLASPIKVTWAETVRGDFREMAVHHIVTNLLVIGSSFFRLTRIGSMVFLVHDISDIPVDLSKLANFLKYKKATVICFLSMVLLWLVFRLGIFPFVIYRSVLKESWVVMEHCDAIYYYCYRYFFYYLVGQIILLHVAWFFMFIRMGWLLVRKGETHDLSEHKKGETQHTLVVSNGSSSSTSNGINGNHANGNGVVNGDHANGNGVVNGNHVNGTNGHAANGSSKKHK